MKASEIAAARRKQVLDLITEKGRTRKDLASLMGLGVESVNNYLTRMVDANEIHFTIEPEAASNGGFRGVRIFRAGPGTEKIGEFDNLPPCRPVTQSWKPNHRRDPLVSALFGAASNEPRCACCRQLQGAPHAAGCRYDGIAA